MEKPVLGSPAAPVLIAPANGLPKIQGTGRVVEVTARLLKNTVLLWKCNLLNELNLYDE